MFRQRKQATIARRNFIYAPQGRIVRYDAEYANDLSVHGLYTDNFFNCNIIAIVSADRTKMSLIHADAGFQQLRYLIDGEIAWVGTSCDKYVLLRDHAEAEEIYSDIFGEEEYGTGFKKITLKINQKVDAIVVMPDERPIKLVTDSSTASFNIIKHPLNDAATAMMLLNSVSNGIFCAHSPDLAEDMEFVRLFFDGRTWMRPGSYEYRFCTLMHIYLTANEVSAAKTGVRLVQNPRGVELLESHLECRFAAGQGKRLMRIIDALIAQRWSDVADRITRPYMQFVTDVLPLLQGNIFITDSLEAQYVSKLTMALGGEHISADTRIKSVLASIMRESNRPFQENFADIKQSIIAALQKLKTTLSATVSQSQDKIDAVVQHRQ